MESAQALERGRFEGEVLARLTSLDKKLDGIVENQTGHEERLRAVEEVQATEKGKNSAIAAGVSAIITIAGLAVSWFAR